MGIQINGTTDTISAADGSLSVPSITNGINISGVSTLGNTVIGGATTEVVVTGSVDVSSTVTSVFGNFTALTASSNSGFHVDGGAPASSFLLGNTGDLSLGNDLTVSGNAGIGTNNPLTKLDVLVGGDQRLLFSTVSSDTSITAANGANSAYKNLNLIGSDIILRPNGTERVRVTGIGSVGIGTDNPRQKLTFGSLTASSTSTPDCIDLGATYSGTNASNLKLKLYTDGSEEYGFGASVNSRLDYVVPSNGNHVFYRGTTESCRINTSGNLAFPSGQGIDFSANTATGTGTTTSSVLDDYERGTWTPSFVQAGTTNNMFVDNNLNIYHADYVKIGNNVWISCYIQNDAAFSYDTGRSSANAIGIGGLPFTVSNTPADSGYYAINVGYFNNWTSWSAGYTPMGYFYTGQNGMALIYAVDNGTNNILAQYLYSANSSILLSGFYQTD